MSRNLRWKWDLLTAALQKERRVLVAFSGGCDSTLLLSAARRTLGKENTLAVTAVSASVAEKEKAAALTLAAAIDVRHLFLGTDELENPAYLANSPERCFFCKNELFSKLAPLASRHRMTVVDGFNASDRGDFRPGFQAAQTWHVRHPLEETGLTKAEIRLLSRWLGLPTWNKPASPCLSSRIPYHTPVTPMILHQIEQAEAVLQANGFRTVRVRHYGPRARIEVPKADLPRLQETKQWARVVAKLQAVGYQEVETDPRGFQSGRLNEELVRVRVREKPSAH